MNRKINKMIFTILITIILIFNVTNIAFANYEPGDFTGTGVGVAEIKNMGNKIIGILQAIGTIVSVIIVMIIGFKYMTGSIEDKVDYKKSMVPYLVGAVCIFLASQIAGVVYDVSTDLSKKSTLETTDQDVNYNHRDL